MQGDLSIIRNVFADANERHIINRRYYWAAGFTRGAARWVPIVGWLPARALPAQGSDVFLVALPIWCPS